MDEPLVYTKLGNLPLASLQYRHEWLEDEVAITFVEEYLLDGEVVKRSAHSRLKQGMQALIESQLLGN
jgi:hypothetical protein